MEENLKKLLIKDLCYRLPYGVICTDSRHGDSKITDINVAIEMVYCDDFDEYIEIKDCKPYLRPMSSMTEDKKKEYELLANHCIVTSIGFIHLEAAPLIDWLNTHHFDYRGLIEKGLALEAPEGMYNLND